MTTVPVKDAVLDSLVWSDIEYRLNEFVERYTLPQLVKVQEGFYGPDEDSCIGAEQILTLHTIKTTEKVLARDRKNKELHVPLNCSQKVELRPLDFRGVYESVEELTQFKFVRVSQGHYSLDDESSSVNLGDKLEVIRVEKGIGNKEDCVLFQNQDRSPIRLPFSVSAGFQPLIDGREYYLKELSVMKLPVYFQFIDPPKPVGHLHRPENVFNSSLGVLKLDKVYHDSSVICTTKEGNMRTVITCPKTLPITVAVAQGALLGDLEYVRLCRVFHEGVSLNRIDNMELENIYASRSTIREYQYIDSWIPPPPIPPRSAANHTSPLVKKRDPIMTKPRANTTGSPSPPRAQTASLTRDSTQEEIKKEDSDEDNEYEYIDEEEIFPPLPPVEYAVCGTVGDVRQTENIESTGITTSFSHSSSSGESANVGNTDYDYIGVEGDAIASNDPPPSYSEQQADKPFVPIYQMPSKNMTGKNMAADKNGTEEPGNKKVAPPPPIKPKPAAKPKPLPSEASFDIPDDLSQMSIREVSKFLVNVHLDKFVDIFVENDIDGEMLVCMTAEEMKALSMNAFQSKKLQKLISGWRPRI